ncbi:MAG: response regulator [Gammaproteobacteria bacterium]|nr:response regulator [Gammaproteobacteria bacterium]
MRNLKYKILMVEDIKVAQKVAMLVLTDELGCNMDIAETGAQALQMVADNSYSLIFMDLGLPDIDGLTVAETIRKNEKNSDPVPIIALTAHRDVGSRERCLEAGMNDFIEKPIKLEDCYRLLKKYARRN